MPGRVLTPTDCYALINAIAKEATGQESTLQAVNTSTFVSVGETILRTGTENVLNAVSLVLGRTLIAVRPYEAKLKIINTTSSGAYANRIRKISYYSRNAEPSGMFNTTLYTNLAMGYDNGSNGGSSVASMWEQNQPIPLTIHFGGSSVWDYHTTIYEDQLKEAFRDESSFASFVSGYLTEAANDIEMQKEAFNRACMLNYLAGVYDLNGVNGAAIDMTAAFNAYMGNPSPALTAADILGPTYFKTFLEFFVTTVKTISDTLTNRSLKYHWSPTKTINGITYDVLRHTPKSKQKFLLYKPFWRAAEAQVLPEIFNDNYLKISNFEGVEFWQNELVPASIDVTPAIPDTSDPTTQTAGSQVQLDYVLGCIYDEDAMLCDYQIEDTLSTPVEARKKYRNVFTHMKRNIINDFTENGVLLYLG